MHRRRWRFYETASGAKPVQSFLDNLTATEAAEVVAPSSSPIAAWRIAEDGEGERSTDSDRPKHHAHVAPKK